MKNDTSVISSMPSRAKQITSTGLMTAVICVIAPFSIPLPISPVPVSLTNFIIFLSIYLLGMKAGTFCVFLYLLLGTAGLPVFSGFSGGPGKLAGPTGGYLIGFLFLALIQGLFMKKFPKKRPAEIAGMITGMAVCYSFGTAWLAWQMDLNFTAALAIGVVPYLPGDAAKIIAAAIAGPKIRSAMKKQNI